MQVVHLQRNPFPDQCSIEVLFASLRGAMRELGREVALVIVPYRSKGLWRRVANIIAAARNEYDICHVTGDVHYVALGLRRDRTVLTIHDCHSLERLSGFRRWLLRVFWYDLPIRRAAMVTVISEETKRQLLRHVQVPADNVHVVPDAVAPIFRPSPRPFRDDCPQILQVGTRPNKNVSRLIQALKGIKCHLKIIGTFDQRLRDELLHSGVSYDAVSNLDEAAMYRAYCESDIVSFVSTYEGFGLPIIEAQYVERPVVTSNCSSMPEVAGEGACLVDPYDVNSIRQGLLRVIDDAKYRESIIEHGRHNRERFSLPSVARQYIELYQKVLNGSAL